MVPSLTTAEMKPGRYSGKQLLEGGAVPKKSRNLIGSEVALFRKGDERLCVIHRT